MQEFPYINYPGSIVNLIYDLININPYVFYIFWKILCLLFLVLLFYFSYLNIKKEKILKKSNLFFSPIFLLLFCLIGIILLTIPNLVLKAQNLDENGWIAEAAAFLNGAIPWKDVSGGSGGPLTYIGISIMYYIIGELNFSSIRLFNFFFCIVPCIIFFYFTLKYTFKKEIAFLLIIPFVLLFAYIKSSALIAFGSECLPMAFLSISLWLLLKIQERKKILIFILGFLLGLLPYAKKQAVPIGLVVAVCALIEILFYQKQNLKEKIHSCIMLFLGGIFPTLFCVFFLFYNDIFSEFWLDDIIYSIKYINAQPIGVSTQFSWIYSMAKNSPDLWAIILSYIILNIFCFIVFLKEKIKIAAIDKRRILFLFFIFISSLFSVALPNYWMPNYQVIAIVPVVDFLCQLPGIVLPIIFLKYSNKKIMYCSFFVIIPLIVICFRGNQGIDFVVKRENYKLSKVSQEVLKYVRTNETMTVWGWGMQYHVETGLLPGIKQICTWFEIRDTNKINNQYLDKYISDISKKKPIVFLDVIGPDAFMYSDRKTQGHENFPELNSFILSNYVFVSEIESVRIYILNSRFEKIHRNKLILKYFGFRKIYVFSLNDNIQSLKLNEL